MHSVCGGHCSAAGTQSSHAGLLIIPKDILHKLKTEKQWTRNMKYTSSITYLRFIMFWIIKLFITAFFFYIIIDSIRSVGSIHVIFQQTTFHLLKVHDNVQY